jgi:hypothetical protein
MGGGLGDEDPKRNAPDGYTQRITRREREIPRVSAVWQNAGFAIVALAASVALAAGTVPKSVAVNSAVLWTAAAALAVLAATCFLAHWDVNRGRKVRHSEIEEERRRA